MNKFIPFAALTALATSGLSMAQTPAFSKPSGYVTQSIKANSFNLVGITLHNASSANGIVDEVTATTFVDNDANFTGSLVAGKTYILEITSGQGLGLTQEITSWTGTALTTSESFVGEVATGTSAYQLRESATISSVFGSDNSAGLLVGTATTADIIYVPNNSGGFDQFYRQPASPPFVPAERWTKVGGNGDFGSKALNFVDSIFIQRRGATDLSLTLTGQVKTTSVTSVVTGGGSFNYVGSVFPVGSTLDNSGLSSSVLAGTATTADIVFVPNNQGGYSQYYYQPAQPPFVPTAQWVKIGTAGNAGATPLTSGLIVQRRGPSARISITPPPSYSNL